MYINTVLRERRRELGLTQEQVAERLGVSTPAVCKWESGATCPDIGLLSPLARLLKTDVNTLLGWSRELTQKELGLFLNGISEAVRAEGLSRGFALAMEKVREYPDCAELMHSVAMLLQGSLTLSAPPDGEREAYAAEITRLYERVADGGDPRYAHRARYMLASRAIADGDYPKAHELIDALPEYDALDKRSLQAQLLQKEGKEAEAARILESKLLSSLQENQATLVSLARFAVSEGDMQTAETLALCAKRETESFGLWECGAYIVPLETAVAQKDGPLALSLLEKMLDSLLTPWDIKACPICRHIPLKEDATDIGAAILPSLIRELETSPEYDFLRSAPGFEALREKYRAFG